jgi:hypothetical protein
MPRGDGSNYSRSLTLREVEKGLSTGQRKIVATYDYRNEQGELLFQTVRFDPKSFAYRQPDGKGGWLWNLKGVRRVLYRLNEILDKPVVYVVEGEKDVDRLWSLGIPATTSPMGARNWRSEYAQLLRDKQVITRLGRFHAKLFRTGSESGWHQCLSDLCTRIAGGEEPLGEGEERRQDFAGDRATALSTGRLSFGKGELVRCRRNRRGALEERLRQAS